MDRNQFHLSSEEHSVSSKPRPVQKYLEGSAKEGALDSEGVFTLAENQALLKLSQAQLPRPSAWLAKVMQAAVLSQAAQVRVKQLRRSTEISFTPGQDLSVRALLAALQSPNLGSKSPEEHLVVRRSAQPIRSAFERFHHRFL